MSILQWSQDIILVEFPPEPGIREELRQVAQMVRDRADCDVVIDFSRVDILTSDSLALLVRLQKLLTDCRQKLTLCHVSAATKGILSVTGLEELFNIAAEKFDALATPQSASQ